MLTPPATEHRVSSDSMRERLESIDRLAEAENFADAIDMAEELSAEFPSEAALREKVAVLRIHYAAKGPPEEQLGPALEALDRAVELDPGRLNAREVRANLTFLLAHQINDPRFFQRALRDFLELERLAPTASAERLSRWRLEAARAAFLAAKNSPRDGADYQLAMNLYSRVDHERMEPSDWFFRGLATLETARPTDDPQRLRLAAACFLRTIEEGSMELEGRYFAADALLSLETPTREEFRQASHLVEELEKAPSRDFLIDALRERLKLRGRMLQDE